MAFDQRAVDDDVDGVDLPAGPLSSIAEVRRYLKYDLPTDLERHVRVQRDEMNEATYTAVTWETIQRRVGPKFRIEIDAAIPRTNCRADIVLYRNLSTGVIAIEVKANAQVRGLVTDLRKLRDYIRRCPDVNYGVVVYFSSVEAADALYREHRAIGARSSTLGRKLAIVRVPVPRNRVSWGR